MKDFLKAVTLTLVPILSFCMIVSFTSKYSETEITVDTPGYNGYQVGATLVVEGTAHIKPEYYVWVFARQENFKPLWYPQGEVIFNDSRDAWYRMVHFGIQKDIGYKFDLAVAVFNEQEHLKLKEYWEDAMKRGDFKPIKMPPAVSAPVLRSVLKVSH